jgi:predicted O-methyltransferase YrrM
MTMEESEERRRLQLERDALLAEREHLLASLRAAGKQDLWAPPGHFYSPIPSIDEVLRCQDRIFAPPPRTLPGIDLREPEQVALLGTFSRYHDEMPWAPQGQSGLLYRYENTAFSYADAVFLHCMLRHIAPRRVLEAGSGWSTCLMLDSNRRFFNDRIQLTAIDPAPATLPQVLQPEDHGRGRLVTCGLQDAPLELFEELQAGDLLFVDSTHVCRIDSDVNRLLFEILPRLADGVWIHFHDIFYPFEYPRAWVLENRAWNEAYALRAFLQYNQHFEIVLFGSFLQRFHGDVLAAVVPTALRSDSGSLWLRKRGRG